MSEALKEITTLSCFTGSGMLDLAFEVALASIGYRSRPLLYVEADAYAVKVIRARIADGLLPDAPIWPDVRTLRAARLRGLVGAVLGGFPCQDLSVAGKQSGLGAGSRSGLFFQMRRIAVECRAPLIGMENVPGIGSTACATDDGRGGVEPAAAVVARALAEVGYLSRWIHLAAEDVGAPHGRNRWWCLASLADAGKAGTGHRPRAPRR